MSDQTPLPPRGGSIPAGLEEPPRYWPPNPQHPEIPQTFDPRVSVQLERAARDRETGMPGRPLARTPKPSSLIRAAVQGRNRSHRDGAMWRRQRRARKAAW